MTLSDADIRAARILIVDDKSANVRLLERLLADGGYGEVSSTRDPHTVCALHRSRDFDLILLDLQMPVMDGFQVMAELQAAACGRYLPVMVITAEPGHKLRALQAGARDFVSKPFDLLEVNTRIRNMLEVRLLYNRLEANNGRLEDAVRERTAELADSQARYRCLTELASDWYWEQDERGDITRESGPVLEMLGLRAGSADGEAAQESAAGDGGGWDEAERASLRAAVLAHQPFIDLPFSRSRADGSQQQFRVSGEPIFSPACNVVGFRGIGVETTPRPAATNREGQGAVRA
jgi:CheY-like chemotaxis protein